ncbi:hypothetical protein [Actinoallomurus sp. CA-150999]|uniref:hypothetical protein n=1 Tax=Actinoallomurus sp. CA-150999 TaxID=3239887 RepID=UPI003D8EEE3E
MYSYYVFEESSFPGSGGRGHVWTFTDLPRMRDAVGDFLRTGWSPQSGGTLAIRVHQRGEESAAYDIHPFLGLKIPGLTEVTWDAERRIHGGEPEPVGSYAFLTTPDGTGERRFRVLSAEEVAPPTEQRSLEVRIDWARMDLPALIPPLLPEAYGDEASRGVGCGDRRPVLDHTDAR